ncbi:MAG: class B sortase [Bacilli bacterium]|nr:class B sortase [Bacilli bacterium]
MKKKKIILIIIMLIFLILIVFSLYKIILWSIDNNKSRELLDDISSDIIINEDISDFNVKEKYIVDFESLKEKNNDVTAWIKVNNTNIEYPVVKTNNNDYYLNHSFDKKPNLAGWPFMNYKNDMSFNDKNITIFAHARKDGSMFGTLKNILTDDYRQKNSDNNIILVSEKESAIYEIFSTYKIEDELYYFKDNFNNDDEFNEFIKNIKSRSNYDYNVNLDDVKQILTLSTCDVNDNYRIVVHAKKVNNI